jgi:exonuclease SbcD
MIRFIHTADIHFGMENYGRIDPITGVHSRLLDFVAALNTCIDYAIAQDVDLFLFCGDAYKTHHPTQMQQRFFFECFLRLYQAKIPVVIIVGNHDNPLSFGKAHALNLFDQLPLDGFYVFEKPGIYVLQTKSGPVSLVGIPWPTRNTIALKTQTLLQTANDITEYISAAVSHIIQELALQLDPAIPAILAGHLTVSTGIFSGSEKKAIYGTDPLFLPSQLAIYPFDYVALGHLHRFQNLNSAGQVPVVYSGSIERVDFGERKEEKGFVDVVIEAKNRLTYTFIPVPTRPFIQVEVVLTESDQTQQIIDQLKKHSLAGAVVKIMYHLKSLETDRVNISMIEKFCTSCHYLVGVIPIVQPKNRIARMGAVSHSNATLDTRSQLDWYFGARAETKDRKEILLKKIFELIGEENDTI